jgi:hypothetical protein
MKQEQPERVLATGYKNVRANKSVQEMLGRPVDVIAQNIGKVFDQAIEASFGLRPADLDARSLEHARTLVKRARHRIVM